MENMEGPCEFREKNSVVDAFQVVLNQVGPCSSIGAACVRRSVEAVHDR